MLDHPRLAVVRGLDAVESPIERLELLAGDDDAIASFLDELDVRGPADREMLAELARSRPLEDPARFPAVHRRSIASLETLGRHGYHGSTAARNVGPFRYVVRWLIQLVARYVVVAYLRRVSAEMRNLYWLREVETETGLPERELVRAAREDADGVVTVFRRREIGLPSFVIGGLLIPLVATGWRVAQGVAFSTWWVAAIASLIMVLVVVGASWIILRGAAMASRRIRLCTRAALDDLWRTVGYCGNPPTDESRKFATVAIALTVCAWIVVPAAVGIALAR